LAQIDIIAAQLAQVIQWINDVEANARKTSEFPLQSPMLTDSLLRVENSLGVSEHIAILDILTKASFQLSNKLLYFNGVNIAGNAVTLLAGSVWRVDNVVYSNIANIPFTVPYTTISGDFRKDLLVGGNSNTDVTQVTGSEAVIPIQPNYPFDKVPLVELLVSDSSITLVDSNVGALIPMTFARLVTAQQNFTIPSGKKARFATVNGAIWNLNDANLAAEPQTFTQPADDVVFKTVLPIGRLVIIYYQ